MPPPNTPVDPAAIPIPSSEPSVSRTDASETENKLQHLSLVGPHPYPLPPLPVAYEKPPVPVQGGTSLVLKHQIDVQALEYIGRTDENLICAICRTPFYDPVMTECQHVFCRSCLWKHIEHRDDIEHRDPTCPTCRRPIQLYGRAASLPCAPPMIKNLVDALRVECPACFNAIDRPYLNNHLEKACLEARICCPGKYEKQECGYHILRKDLTDECLHYLVSCDDCDEQIFMIDMDCHKNQKCENRVRVCADCGAEHTVVTTLNHQTKHCPEWIVPCRWASVGCRITLRRKEMGDHQVDCEYRFVGHRMDFLEQEIRNMRKEMNEKEEDFELRIVDLEQKCKDLAEQLQHCLKIPIEEYDEVAKNNPLANLPENSLGPNTTPSSDFVSHLVDTVLDTLKQRIDKLDQTLKEVEARCTTMIMNESLGIKHDLTELRSLQQTTSMHVRWLMQLRIQENRRRAVTIVGSGNSGGSDNGGGSDDNERASPVVPRRSSDSLREPPRL